VAKSESPTLQVCVLGEDGEVIVQVFEGRAVLTVRSAERERIGEVTLTELQAQTVSDALQQVTEREDEL
jgi:hypothetical protein